MEYSFIGGSMGAVVGETIARAVDRARLTQKPLIVVAASGGARMMEGVVSLMQMAKISTALAQLDDARVPYICVLTDPTTGGVTASFAMLGDLNIGEPGALIGFAGPRVIEQTIRQKLPEGFQRSEFLLEKRVPRCRRPSQGFASLPDSRAGIHEDARRDLRPRRCPLSKHLNAETKARRSCRAFYFEVIIAVRVRLSPATARRYLYSASGSSGRIWPADCESLNSSRTSPALSSALRKSRM